VIAQVRLHFVDAKSKTDCWESRQFVHSSVERAEEFDWNNADCSAGAAIDALDRQPIAGATFDALPDAISRPANFKLWSKMLESHIYQEITLDLFSCIELKLVSKPGESEGDFKSRLQVAVHEKRDAELEKVRKKYGTKMTSLQEQVRKAEARVEKEKDQLGQQKMNTALSFGTTILGALLGRRAMSASTMGRAATAIKGAGKTSKEARDIDMANDSLVALQERYQSMQQELETELQTIKNNNDVDAVTIEPTSIRPRKSDISVTSFGIAWLPYA
jgi:hypothetical protein